MKAEFAARFWMKVRVAPADSCWEWLASLGGYDYGKFWLGGRNVMAHRVSVMLSGREIPDGWQVDHLCRNTLCVNPSHLEPVTPRENTLRSFGVTAINAVKTHCPQNHPFDEANTYLIPSGAGRDCRTCRRNASRRASRRKQGLEVAS